MRGDGFYITPSGIKIPLQGGHANSYITYNMDAGIVGSSTSAGQVTDIVKQRVMESNGYGIVGLMTPSAHGSNPTFFTIYTQVMQDLLGVKGDKREALENKFAELIENGPKSFKKPFLDAEKSAGTRGDQRSTNVLKKILKAKTPKQKFKIFENEGAKLTFKARGAIFNSLGGVNNAKELGIPSFKQLLEDTIDPEFGPNKGQTFASFVTAGTGNGDLVQVMKFDKDKPLSTAEAEGLAKEQAHLSYDVAFVGSPVGRFKKPVPLFDATKNYFKTYRTAEGKKVADRNKLGTTIMKMPHNLELTGDQLLKYIGDYSAVETASRELRFAKKTPFNNDGPLRFSKRFVSKPNLENLIKEEKIKKYNTSYSPPPKKDAE